MKRGLPVVLCALVVMNGALSAQAGIVQGAFKAPIKLALVTANIFESTDTSELVGSLPLLALLHDESFANAAEISMALVPEEVFPIALIVPSEKQELYYYLSDYPASSALPADGKDLQSGKDFQGGKGYSAMVERANRIYYGGEVGMMYGASSGSSAVFKGDEFRTYGVFEVGDDKTQIVVGASYQESNYKFQPRRYR